MARRGAQTLMGDDVVDGETGSVPTVRATDDFNPLKLT